METMANLLVILVFFSALYTLLGALCAIAEQAEKLFSRPQVRRRIRHSKRRRTPRRVVGVAKDRNDPRATALAPVRQRTA